MKLTSKTITHHRDLTIIHAPGERDLALATVTKAEGQPGNPTQNCLVALEAAGFEVVLDGAFRILDDGSLVTDADHVLGQLESEP